MLLLTLAENYICVCVALNCQITSAPSLCQDLPLLLMLVFEAQLPAGEFM